jgi:hypothetical protein
LIEGEEMPSQFPLRLSWLADLPARDLSDLLDVANLGERTVETLRDHASDCVQEASGTASLSQVKLVGRALRSAVGDLSPDKVPA